MHSVCMLVIRWETRGQCIPSLKAIPNLIRLQCPFGNLFTKAYQQFKKRSKQRVKESVQFVCTH